MNEDTVGRALPFPSRDATHMSRDGRGSREGAGGTGSRAVERDWRDRAAAAGRPDDVRYRDGWRCTAIVQPRRFDKAGKTWWFPPEARRCGVVGSEMVVVDGRTLCPRHAREEGARC